MSAVNLDTPHLGLPLLAAAQAQKHVTHNEALAALDALVQLSVIETGRDTPPASPQEGDRYLVGPAPTGAFAGQAGKLAQYDGGLWRFRAPNKGWRLYVEADDRLQVYDGTDWRDIGFYVGDLGVLDQLGIGTAADATNRLAVKTPAALLTARTAAEGGSGDLRLVVNKEAPADTGSCLFQTGFSGRAEIGLTGDDDWRVKVSADGSVWRDAIHVARATGLVSFPQGVVGLSGAGSAATNWLANAEMLVNQRVFAGGALAAGAYGFDRWKAGTGGCTLTRASDGTLTLSGPLVQVIEAPWLAGQSVTVSVESPTGTVNVDVAGETGSITAGSGRRGITLTVPSGATGNVAVTLSGTALSFARPMLVLGTAAGTYQRLPVAAALAWCQRYFCKTYMMATAPGALTVDGALSANPAYIGVGGVLFNFVFPARMRATPTVTIRSTGTGAAGFMRRSDGVDIAVTMYGTSDGITAFYNGAATTLAAHTAHVVAEAEL